jgi:hypothetical protein
LTAQSDLADLMCLGLQHSAQQEDAASEAATPELDVVESAKIGSPHGENKGSAGFAESLRSL